MSHIWDNEGKAHSVDARTVGELRQLASKLYPEAGVKLLNAVNARELPHEADATLLSTLNSSNFVAVPERLPPAPMPAYMKGPDAREEAAATAHFNTGASTSSTRLPKLPMVERSINLTLITHALAALSRSLMTVAEVTGVKTAAKLVDEDDINNDADADEDMEFTDEDEDEFIDDDPETANEEHAVDDDGYEDVNSSDDSETPSQAVVPTDAEIKGLLPSSSLQMIMDMGFSEALGIKALVLTRDNFDEAVKWVLDNMDNEEPLSDEQKTAYVAWKARTTAPTAVDALVSTGGRAAPPAAAQRAAGGRSRFENNVALLVDMGFPEDKSRAVLELLGNVEAAATWLLEDRPIPQPAKEEILDVPVDLNNPIVRKIMRSVRIHTLLSNTNVATALQKFASNPRANMALLEDPDLAALIQQVQKVLKDEL